MNKVFQIIAFFILMDSAFVRAAEPEVLTFVAVEMPGYTNADGSGIYWDILNSVYEAHYKIRTLVVSPAQFQQHIALANVDGYIGAALHQYSHLLIAEHHIDLRYAINILSRKDHSEVSQLLNAKVALKQDAYLQSALGINNNAYPIESIEHIDKLINNKRVDAALIYSYNIHLADPDRQLVSQELIPEQKVNVGFIQDDKGNQLAELFERNFKMQLNSEKIKTIFGNNATYAHANLLKQSTKQSVQWHVIAKKFDPQTQQQSALKSEVNFAEKLESFLSNIDLTVKVNSMRNLRNKLIETDNACIHNLMKTDDRLDIAYFSKPSYAFLSPRLVMKKETAAQFQLEQEAEKSALNLEALLTKFSHLRVTAVKDGNVSKLLTEGFPEHVVRQLYLTENQSLNNTFSLMLSDRVDAVITWPSLISIMIDDEDIAKNLTSFKIKGLETEAINSYVACSKSDVGFEMIEQINRILANEQSRDTLFQAEYEKMDANSAADFKALINTYYQ